MNRQLSMPGAERDADKTFDNAGIWLLCRGVKSILRCDEAEAVSGIASYVVTQRISLRLLSALIERTRRTVVPAAIAIIGGLKCFLEVHAGKRSEGVVWIARLGNERRAIEQHLRSLPEIGWTELKFRRMPDVKAIAELVRNAVRALPRILKLARRLDRRYEFFRTLRVVELIAYYKRYLHIFQSGRFSLAVTSNHSNPHGIAFNLAARKGGVPVVLITHGMPVRPVAKLSYDLGLVHCDAARQTYLEEGCRIDRVLLHGRKQDYDPMRVNALPKRLAVGVFLCKDVNEERLCRLLERLLENRRVARILIRPHPTNLWEGLDAWIASRKDSRVRRSTGGSVARDLATSNIVLAGNSSVLIEAVTSGRPGGYVPGLDRGSPDLHAFVARGLIYPLGEGLDFDPEAMLRFYQKRGWPEVLRLFANIDENEESVVAQAAAAMRELVMLHLGAPRGDADRNPYCQPVAPDSNLLLG